MEQLSREFVAETHPSGDRNEPKRPYVTVTLMWEDIEGSTALNERVGDDDWIDLLNEHNSIVVEQVVEYGGREVKSLGDGFMLVFASARCALECAACIQQAFAVRNAIRPETPLRVRIGLHTGETIHAGNDYFGRHVNVAARVAEQARGGEVLVTQILRDVAEGGGDFRFDAGRDIQLEGLTGEHRVFAVDWQSHHPSG